VTGVQTCALPIYLKVGYEIPGGIVTPVEGVSFDLRPREVVGLVGDAGSGKSTTALALMGLARPPGKILGGQVIFDGQDLLGLADADIRKIRGKDIGLIVQNPRAALNPLLRIGPQIGHAYRAHNTATPAEVRQQAIEMLRLVGINDPERRVEAYAHELSGGMAQRALIASALSSKPRLLIADEPTSGLASTDTLCLVQCLSSFARRNRTVVAVIHQPRHTVRKAVSWRVGLG
jgi:ABC-type dipeptide/oligopeptide/nickel transport system ATPase component